MLHLTNWNRNEIEEGKTYTTPLEISNYWNNKLKGEWVSSDFSFDFLDKFITEFPDLNQIKNQLNELIKHGKYCSELLKEYIFEEIRQKDYCNLPSRKNCLFALPEDSYIQEMRDRFNLAESLYPTVLKIEGIEKEHTRIKVDANFLNCNIGKYKTIVDNAIQYWSGNNTQTPLLEILFQGKFQIKEILK